MNRGKNRPSRIYIGIQLGGTEPSGSAKVHDPGLPPCGYCSETSASPDFPKTGAKSIDFLSGKQARSAGSLGCAILSRHLSCHNSWGKICGLPQFLLLYIPINYCQPARISEIPCDDPQPTNSVIAAGGFPQEIPDGPMVRWPHFLESLQVQELKSKLKAWGSLLQLLGQRWRVARLLKGINGY